MQIDTIFGHGQELASTDAMGRRARELEELGFDGLMVAEIIKSQGIQVDADKVRETIEEAAESYEDPQEVIDYYMQDKNARAGVENVVLENQVVDWVLGQVQVVDERKSFSELMDNKE